MIFNLNLEKTGLINQINQYYRRSLFKYIVTVEKLDFLQFKIIFKNLKSKTDFFFLLLSCIFYSYAVYIRFGKTRVGSEINNFVIFLDKTIMVYKYYIYV